MGPTRRLCAAIVLALLIPATASASQRFASPDGTTGGCTLEQPCDIVTAVNGALSGDDIEIEPGTYGSPSAPITTTLQDFGKFLTIHGKVGAPRPVIYTSAGYGIAVHGGSSISNLDIEDSATNAYAIHVSDNESSITSVIAHTTGDGSWACYPDGEITNSLCWDSGPNGGGARPLVVNSAFVVGDDDTFVATGSGSYGIEIYGEGNTTMSFSVTNSIVRGTVNDVLVQSDIGSSGTVTFAADHSNFATVDNAGGGGTFNITQPGSGTNQTAAPLFVDPPNGDFHEAPGSPTIDAGKDTNITNVDLDGVHRPQGNGFDIGAYEWVPPPTCQTVNATTAFGTAAQIQLSCQDFAHSAVSYFYTQSPQHGTVSVDPATGVATYTPAAGYSGHDDFTYDATSIHGQSEDAVVSITVGPEPSPVISGFGHKGRSFPFTLNEAAKVTLTIKRKGHPSRKVSGQGKAGANVIQLGRKLKPGKYTVSLSATNAGGSTTTKPLKFKIKHKHRARPRSG
jgi:hypothetical protein